VFDYDGGEVQAGYHVTEVIAGSFVALDCGGNPGAWQETMLQVEDIPPREGRSQMRVGEFVSILARVDPKVRLGARPAICKPRHGAQSAEAAACCSPVTTRGGASACCA
jgi:hypothetical protein